METKVTLFELFISIAPIIVGMIGGWMHMKTTITALKTEMKFLQKEVKEEKEGNKENFINLNRKMDSLFGKIGEVRELILNKHNDGTN